MRDFWIYPIDVSSEKGTEPKGYPEENCMFTYMKITDIHLKDTNLERKIPVLTWASNLAVSLAVDVVIDAGDLTESDHFAGRNNTPGAMVKAYKEAFSDHLAKYNIPVHHVRGNHDKKSASRGSSLHCFAGQNDWTWEDIGMEVFRPNKNEHYGVVFVPWMYPEEILGGHDPQVESIDAYRQRYLDVTSEKIKSLHHMLAGDCAFTILAAHCQVRGASLSASQLCKGDEGLVLGPEVLELFNDLHLGDIHMRQEILKGRGGFTGALSQEGFDEEGNPSGVEVVTVDDNGPVEREWHECPVASRYCTTVIEEPEEAAALSSPSPNTIARLRYAHDGSEKAAAIAAVLEPLARQGFLIDPQWNMARKEARTDERLEKLDDPFAALDYYCKAYSVQGERRQGLHEELVTLLA